MKTLTATILLIALYLPSFGQGNSKDRSEKTKWSTMFTAHFLELVEGGVHAQMEKRVEEKRIALIVGVTPYFGLGHQETAGIRASGAFRYYLSKLDRRSSWYVEVDTKVGYMSSQVRYALEGWSSSTDYTFLKQSYPMYGIGFIFGYSASLDKKERFFLDFRAGLRHTYRRVNSSVRIGQFRYQHRTGFLDTEIANWYKAGQPGAKYVLNLGFSYKL